MIDCEMRIRMRNNYIIVVLDGIRTPDSVCDDKGWRIPCIIRQTVLMKWLRGRRISAIIEIPDITKSARQTGKYYRCKLRRHDVASIPGIGGKIKIDSAHCDRQSSNRVTTSKQV